MEPDVSDWRPIPGETPILANIWLRRHESPLILWPEEGIGQESPIRNDYLKALKTADDGDFGPLLALHSQHIAQ
jgi:hypothetical protein